MNAVDSIGSKEWWVRGMGDTSDSGMVTGGTGKVHGVHDDREVGLAHPKTSAKSLPVRMLSIDGRTTRDCAALGRWGPFHFT